MLASIPPPPYLPPSLYCQHVSWHHSQPTMWGQCVMVCMHAAPQYIKHIVLWYQIYIIRDNYNLRTPWSSSHQTFFSHNSRYCAWISWLSLTYLEALDSFNLIAVLSKLGKRLTLWDWESCPLTEWLNSNCFLFQTLFCWHFSCTFLVLCSTFLIIPRYFCRTFS